MGPEDAQRVVRCVVDADHLKQLTREETTAASVHYVHFILDPGSGRCLRRRPGHARRSRTRTTSMALELEAETVRELLADLRG